MKIIKLVFLLSILMSCNKEKQTSIEAYLVNMTTHNIKLFIYSYGLTYPKDTVNLSPNQLFFYGGGNERGINTAPGFVSIYRGKDSIIVKYDNQYPVTHYLNTPTNLATKNYVFTSLRNLIFAPSYRIVITKTTKNSILKEHFYEFTEADYQFARQ